MSELAASSTVMSSPPLWRRGWVILTCLASIFLLWGGLNLAIFWPAPEKYWVPLVHNSGLLLFCASFVWVSFILIISLFRFLATWTAQRLSSQRGWLRVLVHSALVAVQTVASIAVLAQMQLFFRFFNAESWDISFTSDSVKARCLQKNIECTVPPSDALLFDRNIYVYQIEGLKRRLISVIPPEQAFPALDTDESIKEDSAQSASAEAPSAAPDQQPMPPLENLTPPEPDIAPPDVGQTEAHTLSPAPSDLSGAVWVYDNNGIPIPLDQRSLDDVLPGFELDFIDFFVAEPGTYAVFRALTPDNNHYTIWASRPHSWEPNSVTNNGISYDSSDIPWRLLGTVPHFDTVQGAQMYASGRAHITFTDGAVCTSIDGGYSWYLE